MQSVEKYCLELAEHAKTITQNDIETVNKRRKKK